MTTSIKELSQMNRQDALDRAVERIVDASVIDHKIDRAMQVLWVGLESHQTQLTMDEMDSILTEMVLGGSL